MSTSIYWEAGIVSVIRVGSESAPFGIATTVPARLTRPPPVPTSSWVVRVWVVGQTTSLAVPGSGGGVGGVSQLATPSAPKATRAATRRRRAVREILIGGYLCDRTSSTVE